MNTKHHYDLVVVGAGMAGVGAAGKCAARGWSVAIVDRLPYGGTCALRGCDPKKILRRGAEIVDAARLLDGHGVDAGGLAVDWPALMARKQEFTDRTSAGLEAGLVDKGVETLHGDARFVSGGVLEVDGVALSADRFLIAAGRRPRTLAFPGAHHVIDSAQFLELPALPARALFIGGGFVSFEFAHMAARSGTDALIIDRHERPLRGFDPDLVERLVTAGTQAGVRVRTDTTVSRIDAVAGGFRVLLASHGQTQEVDVDLVVHGAGRVPNLDGLHLDAAGVAVTDRGVAVEPHLRSVSHESVWAAGDAADTAGLQITPVAVAEGKVAASNMLDGGTRVPDYMGMPTTVFSIPDLTRVGLLEEEARSRGIDVDVRFSDTGSWYSNFRIGATVGAVKILVDRRTDQIVGGHFLGHEYSELANIVGLGMQLGLTARQLRSVRMSYPTLGSDLGSLL